MKLQNLYLYKRAIRYALSKLNVAKMHPLASPLVTIVTGTLVTMITIATWKVSSLPDNSDVTGAIRKRQRSNSGTNAPELLRYAYVSKSVF
jgi:hypothetical protein